MALVVHQMQSPISPHSPSSKPSTRGVNWRTLTVHFNNRIPDFASLKHDINFRSGILMVSYKCCDRGHPICFKKKASRVSSFKGNAQNNRPDRKDSKISRPPVQISRMQQGKEEFLSESLDIQKHPVPYAPEGNDSMTVRSLAIRKLFVKWLIMLRSPPSNPTMDNNLNERTSQYATSKTQHSIDGTKAGSIPKAMLVYLLGVDAAISIPFFIFIPLFLTIKVVHGAEAARDLMPLWIAGPLIVALYIKVIQRICSLYAFLFVQGGKFVMDLPKHALLVYSCIAEGKLRAYLWTCFVKPFVDISAFKYKDYFSQKYEQLKVVAAENYISLVESLWPYYCRTIRFLKRANLI
ncbi:uncharacterized protein LOC121981411 isoform X1 [Zingiber officinale]|uniref:uncharacterized protein LOC121981411 isoform X1 n=1 Tax=Zingiber officinale TaxID=94328 RepID=UPI001C4AAFA6|nr:uncharacterized protein LOC121981411 isoform X1 [Zingiber officinale]XP_042389842.1 uncharacterized protein LOC121981411 isoform X1 [Zingiber officinale]XP_042389843.1 uncharacterized protein LOC121981411 isoform X1 [Zingiber officinale]XP_042389845.1 uncharacterized protein LOC121981411 isoform X1 [Zingiber officinale]